MASGEPDDLDEEVMASLRENNKNVKSLFEASAPKYKFGGSLTNIDVASTSDEKKKIERKYQQNRKAHGGEERSWVLESINKHFDVIVEDDEDDFSSESEDSEDDESLSLSNDEDKEQSFRVSDQMRNIFKSVVNQITEKDETFNNADILSNLKHKLETYTSSSLQV